MKGKIKYEFSAKMWQHASPGGWYFISLPVNLSMEIRENLKWQEAGWGRMQVLAGIEEQKWQTAIWFDTKLNTYLLPVKAEIRKQANLEIDKTYNLNIWI